MIALNAFSSIFNTQKFEDVVEKRPDDKVLYMLSLMCFYAFITNQKKIA